MIRLLGGTGFGKKLVLRGDGEVTRRKNEFILKEHLWEKAIRNHAAGKSIKEVMENRGRERKS